MRFEGDPVARRLCHQHAGERLRFVEHQEIKPGVGERVHVLLPRRQRFERSSVGEENPRLMSRAAQERRVKSQNAMRWTPST